MELKLEEKNKMRCLNCKRPNVEDGYPCDECAWINEFSYNTTVIADPIAMKTQKIEDKKQICYPPIENKDIKYLPDKLEKAVKEWFKDPDSISKKDKDNIYTNLLNLDIDYWYFKKMKADAKIELAKFFKKIHKRNQSIQEIEDKPLEENYKENYERFEDQIELLPEKLKEGVKNWFKDPKLITKEQRDNIHQNLVNLDIDYWFRKKMKANTKIELARFFRDTNFLVREREV